MSPTMLLVSCLCAVAAFVCVSDGTLRRDVHWQNDDHDDSDNMTRLEAKLSHRLHNTERRLTWRFSRLLKRQNRSALQLEGNVRELRQQLREVTAAAGQRAGLVRRLERRLAKQQRELTRTKTAFRRLEATVGNLSRTIDALLTANGGPPPTQTIPQPVLPADCQDAYTRGDLSHAGDHYAMVQPNRSRQAFRVRCLVRERTGWTVIQRRADGSVDFYRNWQDYKCGFGELAGDFWLGNDNIHRLTSAGRYKLRLELTDWEDRHYWAEYSLFRLSDETDKYRLSVRGYRGNAGDSLTSEWENHDGQQFSTMDDDNDGRFYDNCAQLYHGAWWFRSCFESHLNGMYYHRGTHSDYFVRNGIQWNSVHLHSSLKAVAMMIAPTDGAVVGADGHIIRNAIQ